MYPYDISQEMISWQIAIIFISPAGGISVKSFQIDQSILNNKSQPGPFQKLPSHRQVARQKVLQYQSGALFFKLFGLFQSTKDINALRLAWPNLLMLLTCWPYLADLAWSKWNAAALWRFDMITNKWQRRTRLTYNCAHLRSTKESLIFEYFDIYFL